MTHDDGDRTAANASTTTVLADGTVQARGIGTTTTTASTTVDEEIQTFLHRPTSVKDELRSFFTVWAFVTRLPAPTWSDHHPGYLMKGKLYFPVLGTLIGYYCGVWYQLATAVLPFNDDDDNVNNAYLSSSRIIASCLSFAASLWLTGCFHEDGLADSGDGIGGGWSRREILKIMSDTRLGTYGCAILITYAITKLQLVAVTGMSGLILGHTYSRWTPCYLVRMHPYIDDSEGPKTQYYSFMQQAKYLHTFPRLVLATLYTLLVGYWVLKSWAAAVCLLLVTLFVSIHAGRYAQYLLGGVMGDFLGATICVAEIFVHATVYVLQQKWECGTGGHNYHHGSIDSAAWTCIQTFVVANFTGTREDVIRNIQQHLHSQTGRAILQFLCMILVISTWNRNVGRPDVFVIAERISNTSASTSSKNRTDTTSQPAMDQRHVVQFLKGSLQSSASFTEIYYQIQNYVDGLAKPIGSLGTLEEWAARWGALQQQRGKLAESLSKDNLSLRVCCLIFAGDHGLAKSHAEGGESCSAYPQVVTQSILTALERGVAGASVLAKANDVHLQVIDVGVVGTRSPGKTVFPGAFRLLGGTHNSAVKAAMSREEMDQLLSAGRKAVQAHVVDRGFSVLCLGEVGIGNTTTSSLMLAAILGMDNQIESLVDGGATLERTVDESQVAKKQSIVSKALERYYKTTNKHNGGPFASGNYNKPDAKDIRHILCELGGAENVAMAGALLEAAEQNVPVLVDGFIATVAALAACHLSSQVTRVLFFATASTERGHVLALQAIAQISEEHKDPRPAVPALAMQLRMGEGTGAIMAVPLLRSAIAMLMEMATLQQILAEQHD